MIPELLACLTEIALVSETQPFALTVPGFGSGMAATDFASAVFVLDSGTFPECVGAALQKSVTECLEQAVTAEGIALDVPCLLDLVNRLAPPLPPVVTCELCKGTNLVTCSRCNGLGWKTCRCPDCNDEHETDCPECNGGKVACSLHDNRRKMPSAMFEFGGHVFDARRFAFLRHVSGPAVACFQIEGKPLLLRGPDWLAAVMMMNVEFADRPSFDLSRLSEELP